MCATLTSEPSQHLLAYSSSRHIVVGDGVGVVQYHQIHLR